MPGRRRPRWLFAVFSLSLFGVGLEVGGRCAVTPVSAVAGDFVPDEVLGWRLPASTSFEWHGRLISVNRLGLRGAEPLSEPATRVLFVGDSSVFGDGVADDETMPAQLMRRMAPGVDVQNGGVPGYTCPQSRLLLSRLEASYTPDILISYNQHSDYRLAGPDDRVMVSTRLGPLASTGVGRLVSAGVLWRRVRAGRRNLDVDQYRDCLSAMRADQQARGGRTVFVVPIIADHDFPGSPHYDQPQSLPLGERLTDYRSAMRDVAIDSGSLLVDAPTWLRAEGLSRDSALLDMVHPTPVGHELLARSIAISLAQAGWVGTGEVGG